MDGARPHPDRRPPARYVVDGNNIMRRVATTASSEPASASTPMRNTQKRKLETPSFKPSTAVIDLTGDSSEDDEAENDIPSRPLKRVKPSNSSTSWRTTETITTSKPQPGLHNKKHQTVNQKQASAASSSTQKSITHKQAPAASSSTKPQTTSRTLSSDYDNDEVRGCRYRTKPIKKFQQIHSRALTQRMYVLSRRRDKTRPDLPQETLTLAGTTGNIYTVEIGWPYNTCDCPHARKGNQCKHVLYVMARVLRAPMELQWQAQLTPGEVRGIFERAPPMPEEAAEAMGGDGDDGLRKAIEGECPICCEDFADETGGGGDEAVVYCKASCGNNIHKECFDRWAAAKKCEGKVTCPLCRAPWQGEERSLKDLARSARIGEDGYFNVADELGMSEVRDTSTYNDYFMRRHHGWDW